MNAEVNTSTVTALILAAGAGTRMKSDKPKVVHKVLDVPMIQLVITAAEEAGCERILTIVGHKQEQVRAVVPDTVECVHQPDQKGTADAVVVAADALKGSTGYLLVMCGDMPLLRPETLRQLIDVCRNRSMAVLTAQVDNPSGYGRIVRDETGSIAAIVEDKDASPAELAINEVNTGIYCFALEGLFERLEKIDSDNAQGEYYLTDMVKVCRAEGEAVIGLQLTEAEEAHGVNSRVQLAQAGQFLQKRINEKWMEKGVSIVSSEMTWISPDCELEHDVEVLPNTTIAKGSTVKRGSVIGPNTRMYQATIGEDCAVEESIVHGSRMGDRCTIGPYSYIRPEVDLGNDVRVGPSVEVKKSKIGDGSKIPHLSYIGDATLGEKVNVGAGTITCNYDGTKKSHTTIEDGAFIGSSTMLVAPLTVGQNSVTAAGSTIGEDVPEESLALARARQINKDGWVKKKKEGR
ncbi:MAG: bifunctional UDP-N-acetylglucosamine diphosphorylase/glucosamine-1-phosphate N-acetyltransferase GlmU [Coriobacteriia bacterium]|nr:bifunctional UDP-N-acetylglucosamine diphosphorylase/glucosamine-1-phosphate N-acetyltransferase GlmU [Coriobacteriia bacterium]MCL2746347.1 bifunctional UDP-N-acetylglucosamine diphosphorylase/glucosamine-1-phosphate N-acetyltransferase GlmU [Coriobacteriia bacterium]MCL2871008.1 bifunctional UDP-N-acetylglucosamine diphosphorylase/glucosamine-1-phosphate N-acetyltransferase GlmU [Coriobacteriia bacterium]